MSYCPNFSMVAYAHTDKFFDNGRRKALLARMRCKSWDCDFCLKKNSAAWREFIARKVLELKGSWWLVTLTAHSMTRSMAASYKNLQHGIDVVLKRINRAFAGVEYVRVFEVHPTSDALHAHFIMRNLTDKVSLTVNRNKTVTYRAWRPPTAKKRLWSIRTYLKKVCQEAHIGYICDVSQIRSNEAVFYVTKYLNKHQRRLSIKGIRRVQTSRGFGSPEPESEYIWQPVTFLHAGQFALDEDVQDLQTGEILRPALWEDDFIWTPEKQRKSAL